MTTTSTAIDRDLRGEFLNRTLLLLTIGLWCFIFAGDILPGSLPNIVIFDAFIMIAVCGISYYIKSRGFNFACFFLLFCIALIAVQISIASGTTAVLYLIPATVVLAALLLTPPWLLLMILVDGLFLMAFAPPSEQLFMLTLAAIVLIINSMHRRFFVNQLQISQGFQDYAAEQMNEARESRAVLVLMAKQLQEYQERLRDTNKKLEIAFEQAEESRQAKARFAANVSHELRTPINLIVGFSEVMIHAPEVYDRPLPASYRDDIHAVYRNARHLQNLINDVLDISQLEARHLAIVKEKGDLGECVRQSADMVAELIAKKGLDFDLEIPPDLPDLWFDPLRIRQILLNLLVNAARFTRDGAISIEIAVNENEVITSVIDTGIGLTESDIKHVFEEFYQVDGSDVYDERGSGLGLTLSRELIRLHGGVMNVSSAGVPGQGSRFSFTLPTTQNLVAQMPTSSQPSEREQGEKRVLVIDPDPAVTDFFTRYLKSHQVATCSGEREAMRTLPAFDPDVLIMAPGHDYRQLQEQIALEGASRNIITAPMPSGRAVVRQRGVTDYLVKPVSRDTFVRALSPFGERLQSIMIIDDNHDIVRLFTQTLRSLEQNYIVRSAYGGADGIAMMQENAPDLLLLDLLMPGMDGFAVIETMQASPALRDIPIILISAKGASESITPTIYGDISLKRADGYSPIELVTCVQALIDSIRQPLGRKLSKAPHTDAEAAPFG